jgi:hypothetical protein
MVIIVKWKANFSSMELFQNQCKLALWNGTKKHKSYKIDPILLNPNYALEICYMKKRLQIWVHFRGSISPKNTSTKLVFFTEMAL